MPSRELVAAKKLGIVIVNWNVSALLARCLNSIFASNGIESVHIIVVDNASQDDSVAMLQARFPEIELLLNKENQGYAAANNRGLRAMGFGGEGEVPCYALLLNPDTELPPDALMEMLQFMDERPEVGAAGPKLILPDGQLDLACRRSFPTPSVAFWHFSGMARRFPKSPRFARYNMTYMDEGKEIEVDSVVGAFMLVRAQAIEQVGLLDEIFFMYGEDLDWAFRIRKQGWQIRYNPRVVVQHVKRASSRHSQRAKREFYRAMWLFYRKHYQASSSTWLHYLIMLGILLQGGWGIWREMGKVRIKDTRQ